MSEKFIIDYINIYDYIEDRIPYIFVDKAEIIDKQYDFCTIGNKILKTIDGEYIKNKYNLKPGIEFGRKLHEERVKWLKNNIK